MLKNYTSKIRAYLQEPKLNADGSVALDSEGHVIYKYEMKGSSEKKMTGVGDSKGFHGQYENCDNCGGYGDEAYGRTSSGEPANKIISKQGVVGVPLSDGSTAVIVNYPSVKSPTLEGWNHIRNSGNIQAEQVIEEILFDNNKWALQRKTNGDIGTYMMQNLSILENEQLIAAVRNAYPNSATGQVPVEIVFKDKKIIFAISKNNGSFHTAYITNVLSL